MFQKSLALAGALIVTAYAFAGHGAHTAPSDPTRTETLSLPFDKQACNDRTDEFTFVDVDLDVPE